MGRNEAANLFGRKQSTHRKSTNKSHKKKVDLSKKKTGKGGDDDVGDNPSNNKNPGDKGGNEDKKDAMVAEEGQFKTADICCKLYQELMGGVASYFSS